MARNRTDDLNYDSFNDDAVLLDLDDLDQEESEILAALAVHDERFGRRGLREEY